MNLFKMSSGEEEGNFKPGSILRERWEIKKRLGSGGFGQIYTAYDQKKEKDVAVKVEQKKDQEEVLRMELDVLLTLTGKPHFCKVYGSGSDPKFNFLIMSLCGPNLSELRKSAPNQYFSLCTCLHLTAQCVEAVKHLHYGGYLHRDLKPSNYCMGKYGNNRRVVYLLDFGLARRFVNDEGQIRAPRIQCAFRGTVRYASVNMHMKKEVGRVDDLWSIFYVFAEMLLGKLPWRHESSHDGVMEMKYQHTPEKLIGKLPCVKTLLKLLFHLDELKYPDEPNYDLVMSLLQEAWPEGCTEHDQFDWENSWVKCKTKCPY